MPVTVATYPSLCEAARAYAASRSARFMGGGTVLMRAVNEADPSFDTLIRTTDPQIRAIRAAAGSIAIGAAVTMADVIESRECAFLAGVARLIGGPQVRAAATVAGNLFAAPPYGDFAAALLALGAVVETADGRRQSVEDFLLARAPRVLVSALHVPVPREPLLFKKVSRVKPKGVSVMSIAALLPRQGGRIEGARIVFNAMGERPMRAGGAERALNGRALDESAIAAAASAAPDGLAPHDDAIASAWYRREVAGVHLRRLLEEAR